MVLSNELLDILQQLKDKSGLTNDETGRLAGLSTATVRRYITGEVKDAPRATIEKIIIALGGNVTDILGVKEALDVEIYKSMLQDIRADHKEEIARMTEEHNQIVSNKDKWIARLFLTCIGLVVILLAVMIWALVLDAQLHDFGLLQH